MRALVDAWPARSAAAVPTSALLAVWVVAAVPEGPWMSSGWVGSCGKGKGKGGTWWNSALTLDSPTLLASCVAGVQGTQGQTKALAAKPGAGTAAPMMPRVVGGPV